MNIILDDEMTLADGLLETLEKAAVLCIEAEGLDPDICEISLTVVDKEEIQELNRTYRDKDSVTDVLSFPQFDFYEEVVYDEEILLGDVVICDDVAREQAVEYGHSYEREFVYLFVHSVHHLLGYDHMEEEEKAEMRAAEESVMEALGIIR